MNFHSQSAHEVFSVQAPNSDVVARVMADLLSPGGLHPVQTEVIGYGENAESVVEVAPDVLPYEIHMLAKAAGATVESHREPVTKPVDAKYTEFAD